MNNFDLKFYAAIGGTIIGLCGFLYGVWKDLKLRRIQKRANAPRFIVTDVLLDIAGYSKPNGKQGYYSWKEKPSKLGETLFAKDHGDGVIPDDYPNDRPAGIRLKNDGPKIRYFKIKCKEFIFKKFVCEYDVYDLYYQFNNREFGEKRFFKIWYETEKGTQGKQHWEVTLGNAEIRRVKPG